MSSSMASVLPVVDLPQPWREDMFALMETYYLGVEKSRFEEDLKEKDWVVLLAEPHGPVRGFTSLKLLECQVAGVPIRAVYSGDTVVDVAWRRSLSLEKAWIPFVFSMVNNQVGYRWYWFMVCKGYRTYRYFPTHFYRYIPNVQSTESAFDRVVLNTLAELKFGRAFDQTTGLVTPACDYVLKPGVADVTARELANPHISLFVTRNPNWQEGTELACLAELTPDNLRSFIRRLLPSAEGASP